MTTETIRQLNDEHRKEGKFFLTGSLAPVVKADDTLIAEIAVPIIEYDNFTPGNDPHEEHDMGVFELRGEKVCWKIDDYDLDLRMHSPDPSDPTVTRRVLTVFYLNDY